MTASQPDASGTRTAANGAAVEWLAQVDSTNDELRRRFVAEQSIAPFATIATTSQTAGRGRLDREWVDTPGASLAMSTFVRFPADAARESIGWVALAAGAALRATLVAVAPNLDCGIKWPNDVLIAEQKVAGILGEVLGVVDGGAEFACVIGTGVNLARTSGALPQATSLAEHGVEIAATELAERYAGELADRIRNLIAHGGDAIASGLHDELTTHCITLGCPVEVTLADGDVKQGAALGLERDGRLRVRAFAADATTEPAAAPEFSVHVGDITHLRVREGQAS